MALQADSVETKLKTFYGALTELEAFKDRGHIVFDQGFVILNMVHIGSVVHQRTKLDIQSLIHCFTEPEPGLGQVCGIDLHATQVKVIQAVFPQGMFEALLRALSRSLAHQAGDLGCPQLSSASTICTPRKPLAPVTITL